MNSSNDDKIKQYSDKIEKKRKELGKKPKSGYITNGMIKLNNGESVNINTVSSVEACVTLVSILVYLKSAWNEACEFDSEWEGKCRRCECASRIMDGK